MTEFNDIKRMLEIMAEHDLEEFELERKGVRVRLRKRSEPPARTPVVSAAKPEGLGDSASGATVVSNEESTDDGLILVKSPIVGTFYRGADPAAEPFVEVGAAVRKGEVLCIIEAMKLMNKIDSEYDGEIVSILFENGQPVQYGETLFTMRPV